MSMLIMKYSFVLGETGMWPLGDSYCNHTRDEAQCLDDMSACRIVPGKWGPPNSIVMSVIYSKLFLTLVDKPVR
jgi:hypothetical protein